MAADDEDPDDPDDDAAAAIDCCCCSNASAEQTETCTGQHLSFDPFLVFFPAENAIEVSHTAVHAQFWAGCKDMRVPPVVCAMRMPFDEKSNHWSIVSGRRGRSTVFRRRGAPVYEAEEEEDGIKTGE